ncbi:MAG: hypothetical protein K0R57_1565 [Paenibacillaceae bacterium]|jgi:HSP20 family molecular chaperone IbpA|nr:hypothetical protein [Paenibacillaceae bacterium]
MTGNLVPDGKRGMIMTARGGNGPDWEQMQKWMGGQFPYMTDKFRKQMGAGGTDWVGEYVQHVLKRSLADRGGAPWTEEEASGEVSTSSSPQDNELDYDYEVFETHKSVIARVTVPAEVQIRNVRVYAGAMQLKLEQDPARRKMYIRLPCAVDGSSVRATLKERVLEIRCSRLEEAEMYQEVRVRYL